MTPVSRKKLPAKTKELLQEALVASLRNSSSDELERVFQALLTKTELAMLQKRLAIIFLLNEDFETDEISKITKTTRQTVNRIRLQLLEMPKEYVDLLMSKLSKWKNLNILKEVGKQLSKVPISRAEFRKKITPF
ncbi:hypothetical protein KKB40_03990 [Patescibacteria group bacterium]|nr:hypothetical protein [Patescibacteria group bacterium]